MQHLQPSAGEKENDLIFGKGDWRKKQEAIRAQTVAKGNTLVPPPSGAGSARSPTSDSDRSSACLFLNFRFYLC